MEQGDDVEGGEQLGVQQIDVAEVGLIVARQFGVLDRELDEVVVLLGRGGDADDIVGGALGEVGQPDVVVPAGAEMVDGLAADALGFQPFHEVDIARALIDVEIPIHVPDLQHLGLPQLPFIWPDISWAKCGLSSEGGRGQPFRSTLTLCDVKVE